MAQASAKLRLVLASWLADATSSKPSEDVKNNGLCAYVLKRGGYELDEEIANFFHRQFKCITTPFNPAGLFGVGGYLTEKGIQHKNKHRLEWVREQLAMPVLDKFKD